MMKDIPWLILVLLLWLLGCFFIYAGMRIIQKMRVWVIKRAIGRGGFDEPYLVEGKGAKYKGIDKVGIGCLLLLLSAFFFIFGLINRL
jgi:hypothetical protein